ncbi:hypothetical protein SAMN05444483_11348 [Salegentibacter echinorum]|uniref:Uncharacterized protein n=1 Tax=Salegentibacter echinorum TaxID=1073325 RepID=A0A1M5K4Y1_SALEC|nr:hypothetical protein SAMN05444483_11348 [Salegentibacter echinorum]
MLTKLILFGGSVGLFNFIGDYFTAVQSSISFNQQKRFYYQDIDFKLVLRAPNH